MKIIIGLGNTGDKFKRTRHNIGFRLLKAFKSKHNFPRWKEDKYLKARVSKKQLNEKAVVLGLPQTMMNSSGESAKEFLDRFEISLDDLWIIHDDKDLELGELRIVKNSGSAGHKGVQSVIDQFGSKNFVRFRVGIMTNFEKRIPRTKKQVSKFVLGKFFEEEKEEVKKVKKRGLKALEGALKDGYSDAMQKFNS